MSQEDIRDLLIELDEEASLSQLCALASKRFPSRTLNTYISEQLEKMEQKGLVQATTENGNTKWVLTEKGKETSLATMICDLGSVIDEELLSKNDITIGNIVGTLDLGRPFDLGSLSEDLDNTDYHPERYHSIIFRPQLDSSTTILIPNSGKVSITGVTNKQEIITSAELLLDCLSDLGIEIDNSPEDIAIQNIVANFDLKREFDLTTLSVGLGFEQTEYEPEQFPGMITRSSYNATVLVFRSGKSVITGAKSFREVLLVAKELCEKINDIGLTPPLKFNDE